MPRPVPSRRTSRRLRAAAVLPALALTVLAAAPATAGGWPPGQGDPTVTTVEYLPGLEGELYLPDRPGRSQARVPLVVLAPGGGWVAADRTGLGQLADALARDGVAVYNTTFRIGTDDAVFPVPVQDIACAVDGAAAAVREAGLRPGPVVLLGHSSGAHLTSLAAFGAEDFGAGDCPHPDEEIDGWVGLSGFYDPTFVEPAIAPLLGGTLAEIPDVYTRATTTTHVPTDHARRHLDALVVQGDADEFGITVDYARGLADTIRAAGFDTRFHAVAGGDHHATYQAPVVADLITCWLRQVER